jgi:hypothetical protein
MKGEPDSIGHLDRLVKFGTDPILEKMMEDEVMHWNGRAQNICTTIGEWSFNNRTSIAVVGKSGRFAAVNRLRMNDVDITRENRVPYFIRKDLSSCPTGVICHSGQLCITGRIALDFVLGLESTK